MEPSRFAMILFGALTLVFAVIYLVVTVLVGFFPIEDLALGIFSGILFIFGLVLVIIVIITPNHPIIAYSGGILTVFFGILYTAFSFSIIVTSFGYALAFAVMCVIDAMIFLGATRRYYSDSTNYKPKDNYLEEYYRGP